MNRREFLVGAASGAALTGCRTLGRPAAFSGISTDKSYDLTVGGSLRLEWPGCSESVRLWVIGDTHLALRDERDADHADHCVRMSQWPGKKGPFEAMLARAQREKPDLLVLVGDNMSFPTLANVDYLKSALESCGRPWIYVAGNHDWHFEGESGSDLEQRARWTEGRLKPLYQGANPLMASRVVKGVRLVMIDNSAYHVLPEQLDFYRAEAEKGDPVCLCMHIPLWTPGAKVLTCGSPTWGASTDPYWQVERRERWAERLLPSTFAFREAVLATPNLVGVFAGHLHVLQVVRQAGQNLFTVPANRAGEFLDVTVGGRT